MAGTGAPSERISGLPAAGPLTGSELFLITQGGRTVVVPLTQIAAFLGTVVPPVVGIGVYGQSTYDNCVYGVEPSLPVGIFGQSTYGGSVYA
jgi:hypothetical protein